jgi:hypothetical protein
MVSCPRASSSVPHIEGEVAQERLTVFVPVRTVCDRSPMTVRGGGGPGRNHGSHAVVQNGSAAAYKDVARTIVHHTRAPLDVVIPDHSKCAVVLGADPVLLLGQG